MPIYGAGKDMLKLVTIWLSYW